MKKIKLYGKHLGKVVLVSDESFDELNHWGWQINSSGYVSRSVKLKGGKRKIEFMHHRVLKKKNGFEIDHINRNKLDNRSCNLRYATRSQQLANSGMRKNTISGYKGVWRHPKTIKKWHAEVLVNGKKHRLGKYETKEEAALAYNKAAKKYFGEFAFLNNVPSST